MIADFQTFNLHPQVLQAIVDLDYKEPTPIQAQAIPALLSGHDVLGQSQTGTGKTAAFALPMLQALEPSTHGVQGLVIAPTRELAIQVAGAIHEYGHHMGVRVLPIYGGQSYDRQINRLRRGVDVVVGTPGRMLDLIRRGALDLSSVRYLVLDEADEMLSMGFIEDIEAILRETPETRQTALFSATLPEPIRRLADRYMQEPEAVLIPGKQLTVEKTEQRCYLVNESDKLAALTRLLEIEPVTSALVFMRTKVRSAELAEALMARGIQVEALHGDLSQAARESVMGRFRKGQITVLVATDVAARGLDIDDISHVFNYDIPFDPEAYVHRIGRTGRAGKTGVAITLLTPRERRRLQAIESYTKQPVEQTTLPSVADVLAHRDAQFVQQMQEELGSIGWETRELVIRLCEAGHAPAEVAAAAIQLARAGERQRPVEVVHEVRQRERPKTRDKSAREGRKARTSKRHREGKHEAGMVRLTMSVGKAQGIRPGDIVGSIAGQAGIPGSAIGAIDIQKQRTFVDVAEKHVDRILEKMQRYRLQGHNVTLNRAD